MDPMTPRQAAALIRSLRWPKGPVCPYCGALGPLSAKRDYRGHLTYHRCSRCRRFFSELTGTVMERSKIDLPTWFHFIYHIDRGQCVCHLADRTAYSRTACQRLAQNIRRSELCRQIRAILETRVLRTQRAAQVQRQAFEKEYLARIEWEAESRPASPNSGEPSTCVPERRPASPLWGGLRGGKVEQPHADPRPHLPTQHPKPTHPAPSRGR